ncbi:MAG: PEP-CTERM sorting domain-containing protein [Planctomycetota bacterium]|nr:PEP-CTERM sorting domain-containing protein [Planctomycetota bacterium]
MKRTGMLLMAAAVVLGGGQLALADYTAYISSTNPVGWWGMNETGGASLSATADLSGAYGALNNGLGVNVNMTYGTPGVYTLTDQAGFAGTGMAASNKSTYFNGQQPKVPYAGAFGNGPDIDPGLEAPVYRYETGFSAEAWVKRDGSTGVDDQIIMAGREWKLAIRDGDGVLRFTTWGKQDYFGDAHVVAPTDSNWHQVGISWDGATSTVSFYLDGAPAGSQVAGNPGLRPIANPAYNTFCLGRGRDTDGTGGLQQFRGWIDEAVIWGTTRSDADFAASYLAATSAPWAFIPGDFNKDGEVGPEDFGILKDNFGIDGLPFGAHQSWTLGDANDDGEIGPEDFGLLKDNFGIDGGPTGTYPLTNAPEPTTMALLALGAVGLIRRRRTA